MKSTIYGIQAYISAQHKNGEPFIPSQNPYFLINILFDRPKLIGRALVIYLLDSSGDFYHVGIWGLSEEDIQTDINLTAYASLIDFPQKAVCMESDQLDRLWYALLSTHFKQFTNSIESVAQNLQRRKRHALNFSNTFTRKLRISSAPLFRPA